MCQLAGLCFCIPLPGLQSLELLYREKPAHVLLVSSPHTLRSIVSLHGVGEVTIHLPRLSHFHVEEERGLGETTSSYHMAPEAAPDCPNPSLDSV